MILVKKIKAICGISYNLISLYPYRKRCLISDKKYRPNISQKYQGNVNTNSLSNGYDGRSEVRRADTRYSTSRIGGGNF